jgi:hypothetical protein
MTYPYEWPMTKLYIKPFTDLFTPMGSSVLLNSFDQWEFPTYQFDVALRDDGKFLTCYLKPGYYFFIQSGTNYNSLIGEPTMISYSTGSNKAPILEKSNTGYLLTWRWSEQVRLLRIDSDGIPLSESQVIIGEDGIAQGDPGLAVSDSSGNFAICWQDSRNDEGDIYCRQFNPDGNFFGNEYRVNSDPVGPLQKEPAVALGPDDRIYFTWTDFRNEGGQGDIYCKVIEWEDALYVEEGTHPLPAKFALHKPYPNPFNATTAISYQLPAASRVSLRVYDTSGRMVKELVNGWREARAYTVTFDGSRLASGVYIVRLTTVSQKACAKLVLIK